MSERYYSKHKIRLKATSIRRDIISMHCSGKSMYEISRATKAPVLEIKIVISKFERLLTRIRHNAVPTRSLSKNELRIIIEEALLQNIEAINMMVKPQMERRMKEERGKLEKVQEEIKSMLKFINDVKERKELHELFEM